MVPASTFLLNRAELYPSFTRDELIRIQRHAYDILSHGIRPRHSFMHNNGVRKTNLPHPVNPVPRFYSPFKPTTYDTSTSRTPLTFFEPSTVESPKPISEPKVELQTWKSVETSKKITRLPSMVPFDTLLDLSKTELPKPISEAKLQKAKVERGKKFNKDSKTAINTILKLQEKQRLQGARNEIKNKLRVSPLLPERLSDSKLGSTFDAPRKITTKSGSVYNGIDDNALQSFKVFEAVPKDNL